MNNALISEARKNFHRNMLENNTLTTTKEGVMSNADSSSAYSKSIAFRTAEIISSGCEHGINIAGKAAGQVLGRQFEVLVSEFLRDTFLKLGNIRPGKWVITRAKTGAKTSDFAQYEHLEILSRLVDENPGLAASIGNEYIIIPDIVIYRELCEDSEINSHLKIVSDDSALCADIRKSNGGRPILHASISVKYTLRSDRAQNSRTEALNLIRNRKGHLPHIAAVTAEPMPGRIASLALGTGDIDCVYHFALYELAEAVRDSGSDDSREILDTLINGKRLKDISDLPLDLAV